MLPENRIEGELMKVWREEYEIAFQQSREANGEMHDGDSASLSVH